MHYIYFVLLRRVVYNAQLNGYRVCVINHVGTLTTVPVTSPRIFMYGNTSDYAAMIKVGSDWLICTMNTDF